jgi:DNA-binding NtrC family response regulator
MSVSELLRDKTILIVDDEPDVLDTLSDLLEAETEMILHKATTFEVARQLIFSHNYDLVILDIMGVQGFDLLELAFHRGFPVIMLTAHALNPQAFKKSIEGGARAYLPKNHLDLVISLMEEILKSKEQPVWKAVLSKLFAIFDERFGSTWRNSEEDFWLDVQNRMSLDEPVVITPRKRHK